LAVVEGRGKSVRDRRKQVRTKILTLGYSAKKQHNGRYQPNGRDPSVKNRDPRNQNTKKKKQKKKKTHNAFFCQTQKKSPTVVSKVRSEKGPGLEHCKKGTEKRGILQREKTWNQFKPGSSWGGRKKRFLAAKAGEGKRKGRDRRGKRPEKILNH